MSEPKEAYDYGEFQEAAAPDDLHQLAELAKQMFEAEQEVDRCTKKLEKATKALRTVAERDIPELMDKCGMAEFTTNTGLHLIVKQLVRASISKANRLKAVEWLDENGHGGLVKRKVWVDFTRDQQDAAKQLLEELREKGFENVAEDANVHPQTLGAWVRERLAEGEAFPEKLFGVNKHKVAKISTK